MLKAGKKPASRPSANDYAVTVATLLSKSLQTVPLGAVVCIDMNINSAGFVPLGTCVGGKKSARRQVAIAGSSSAARTKTTTPNTIMKKLSKSLAALAAASVFSVGIMFAASGDSKVAGCCTKAKDAGKTCSH